MLVIHMKVIEKADSGDSSKAMAFLRGSDYYHPERFVCVVSHEISFYE